MHAGLETCFKKNRIPMMSDRPCNNKNSFLEYYGKLYYTSLYYSKHY